MASINGVGGMMRGTQGRPDYYSMGYGAGYGYIAYDCSRKTEGGFAEVAEVKAERWRIPLDDKSAFVRGFVDYCETH